MLFSKRTGVGFEPVTSWLRTSGTNHYAITALILPKENSSLSYFNLFVLDSSELNGQRDIPFSLRPKSLGSNAERQKEYFIILSWRSVMKNNIVHVTEKYDNFVRPSSNVECGK